MAAPTGLEPRRHNPPRLEASGTRGKVSRKVWRNGQKTGSGKPVNVQALTKRAKAVWTRSAIPIQARSRDDGCINRPDKRKHPTLRDQISRTPPCIRRGVHTRTFRQAASRKVHAA